MTQTTYQIGELVVLVSGEWQGHAGIVSWPVSPEDAGYVLVYSNGRVAGLSTSYKEIQPTDETAEGYTQLAYLLIKLSSHLIEKAILPLTRFPIPKASLIYPPRGSTYRTHPANLP